MDEIAMDGRDLEVSSNGGDWSVGWYPPPDPPPGTPHGAAAVCVSDDRVVLVSSDGQRWGLPGGRPEPHERWVDTLRREVAEEACAQVASARLLGFTRGVCVGGPRRGWCWSGRCGGRRSTCGAGRRGLRSPTAGWCQPGRRCGWCSAPSPTWAPSTAACSPKPPSHPQTEVIGR